MTQKSRSPLSLRALSAPCLATLTVAGGAILAGAAFGEGGGEEPPETIEISGVVRDFQECTEPDGHPDFEQRPDRGFGRYSGNIASLLGPDRNPVFTGLGHKIASQWRDSEHRQICFRLYDPALGDTEGSFAQSSTGGITSPESFAQWFNDDPGMNISAALSLTLVRQENGHYVFDDREDPYYMSLGGFFPIDGKYFGNSSGENHNYHFTYEMHMEFAYDASGDQFFLFVGDDDVWVFIDDKLVIDLGGVHAAHDQYVDMNRLGLVDGKEYTIDFFFAERFRPGSNFRIETNIPVRVAGLPPLTAAFD